MSSIDTTLGVSERHDEMVHDLVSESAYRSRMEALLFNPSRGGWFFDWYSDSGVFRKVRSNCCGTSAFVAGIQEFMGREWDKVDSERDRIDINGGYMVCLPANSADQPAFIGIKVMEWFLGNPAFAQEVPFWESNGEITAIRWSQQKYSSTPRYTPPVLQHIAVYLGERDGQHYIFHQPETGRNFEVATIEGYVRDMARRRYIQFRNGDYESNMPNAYNGRCETLSIAFYRLAQPRIEQFKITSSQ